MNANTKFFIGIDVSKTFFDAALMVVVAHQKQAVETAHFENTSIGLKAFKKWLKTHAVAMDEHTLLVIENTGVYHRRIWEFCSKNGLPIHIGNAAHIKKSFGIARGKNDKIDSIRLCKYACRESDELKATPALNPILMELKDFMTARTKLLSQFNSIKTYIKELKTMSHKSTQKLLEQAHKAALDGVAKSLKKLEAQINKIITANAEFKKNYNLLITVPGIGHLTATYLICCTGNFAGKISGKQLACYAGVAPFGNTSGTSIKGRDHVHHMANKGLKKLLHLCSLTAIQHYPEFKTYYDRKKAEGKHSLSVLNAIKNKIALRAVAVINHQKPYVNNQSIAA
ncbi:MAG: IS110 family transposase [Chitinophagaceae bacterium]|nr:MAG: IS110 family transposase [Chitinophagaceae bacterium]